MTHTSNRRLRTYAGRRLAVIAFVLLAVATVAFGSSGQWVRSPGGDCPEGQICADWEVDGVVQSSCCIDPQYLGSSFYGACAVSRPATQ